jgi:hypothetical protein
MKSFYNMNSKRVKLLAQIIGVTNLVYGIDQSIFKGSFKNQ